MTSLFCCLLSRCLDHGILGGKNLSVASRCGEVVSTRSLQCPSCGDRPSQCKDIHLFRAYLTKLSSSFALLRSLVSILDVHSGFPEKEGHACPRGAEISAHR
jgi:hypothetical protein